MSPSAIELVGLALLVCTAGALHWYLRRLGRRLPRVFSRAAAGRGLDPRREAERWQRRVEIALLVPKVGIWIGLAWLLSVRLPELDMSRDAALALVSRSLTAPLFTLGDRSYSAVHLVALPALLGGLWVGVSGIVALGKRQLARLTGGERGVHESLAILARLLLSFLGAIVIFQAWGLDVSSLTFLASILGVGIGFGLQNIANNFVSGILIGLERPVQPGDFVQVGEFAGTVRKIGARSTAIETADRITILVPNARFLEVEVTNWSYGSPLCRLHVPVPVAHGSDPLRVRGALLEAAREHPRVRSDPRPQARFRAFGASALEFELLVWTTDPRGQSRLRSDLYFRIAASLARHGIAVPSASADLELRSPEILEAVRAWTQRTFSDEELARVRAPAPRPPVEAPSHVEPADPPGEWSERDLADLVLRMRRPGALAILDRRHLLRTHTRCFVGSEAVDWLVREERLSREEAVTVGMLLVERGLARHVLDEHGFRDGHFYYRFRADERDRDAEDTAASKSPNAA